MGKGKDRSVGSAVEGTENLGVVKVRTRKGCTVFGGELEGRGGTGGEGFSGTNAGASGFNETLEGAVSERDAGGRGTPGTTSEGGRVDEASDLVTRGTCCTFGAGGKNEGGVYGGADPFGWWGCSTDSGSFSERGGVGPIAGCAKTEERWSPPKTDKEEAPPNTELAVKGFVVETRTENAFLGGGVSRPCWLVIADGENVDPPKTDGICRGMDSKVVGSGSMPYPTCPAEGGGFPSTSTSSRDPSWSS